MACNRFNLVCAIQRLIVIRQLSIYLIMVALVMSAILIAMYPTANMLMIGMVNSIMLFIVRWAAQREAEQF